MTITQFSKTLNELIKKSKLTKTQLTKRAGISRASLYNLLNGDVAESKLSTLIKLASALGVHPLDIINPYFKNCIRSNSYSRNKAGTSFIEDVTYPDYSVVLPNQRLVKTWSVINTGRGAWENLFLTCQDDPINIRGTALGLIPESRTVPIPYTPAGQKVQVSVKLTAPTLPCTVKSEWKTTDAEENLVFPEKIPLYCVVKVCSL